MGASSFLPARDIVLAFDALPVEEFQGILQGGFGVRAPVGETLASLFCRTWGLSREYVTGRISTIFLDGHPVDDIDRAVVREGARLSLSAAMPGLVGAVLRRGGALASMRSSISHREPGGCSREGEGTVRVKLFNLLIAELGPLLLSRGILLAAGEVGEFAAGRPASFWKACREIRIDGRAAAREDLLGSHDGELVLLRAGGGAGAAPGGGACGSR